MKRSVVFVVLIVLCTALSAADTIMVDYVEGVCGVHIDGRWEELTPGYVLSVDDTIRLDDGSIIELFDGTATITITRAGTYLLSGIIESGSKMKRVGLAAMLMDKFKNLLTGRNADVPGVSGGVRASDYNPDGSLSVDYMDSVSGEYLVRGKQFLDENKILEAYDQFRKSLETAISYNETPQRDESRYYLACIRTMQDEKGLALELLADTVPSPESAYYADFYILKARLLLESFAFESAVEWLDTFSDIQNGRDPATLQLVLLLRGAGYYGMGDSVTAKKIFTETIELQPDSEVAGVARNYLSEMSEISDL